MKPRYRMTRYITIAVVAALFLGSCSSYTPDKRELKPEQMPEQYSLYPDTSSDSPDRWWETFQSDELNQLIERGLENNLNIIQARARIKKAKAALERVGGATVPSVGLNSGITRTQSPAGDAVEAYSLGLSASYELDLWGRVDALVEGQQFAYQATKADLETSVMSIAASIAETWLSIISTRLTIEILEEQVKNNQTLLMLLETRFENAMTDALDVLQQQEALAASKAAIPRLEAQEQVLLNNLALLLGHPTRKSVLVNQKTLPVVGQLPSPGIPADLLARRPDIRSAGLNLKSSDWDIAAARANRLPSVSLSGSYRYASNDFGTLFDNWVFSLGASLIANLYDGGAKSAEVKRLQAGVEEELARYKHTVFSAIYDVENGIINEKKQVETIVLLDRQLSLARAALSEAERRYTNGLKSFLPVITEIPKVQMLEKQIVSEKAALLKYRIALYRALGGSWARELVPPENET